MKRNWLAICGVPNAHLMWALATIDLSSELGQRLMAQLPEYFTEEPESGPVPLSVMQKTARDNAIAQGGAGLDAHELLNCYKAVPAHIPVQGFYYYEEHRPFNFPGTFLPSGVDRDTPFGGIVIWEGRKYVVIENNDDGGELWVIPAELVALDK